MIIIIIIKDIYDMGTEHRRGILNFFAWLD